MKLLLCFLVVLPSALYTMRDSSPAIKRQRSNPAPALSKSSTSALPSLYTALEHHPEMTRLLLNAGNTITETNLKTLEDYTQLNTAITTQQPAPAMLIKAVKLGFLDFTKRLILLLLPTFSLIRELNQSAQQQYLNSHNSAYRDIQRILVKYADMLMFIEGSNQNNKQVPTDIVRALAYRTLY